MKKKLLALSLTFALAFGLAACGSGSNPAGADNSSTPSAPAGQEETSGGGELITVGFAQVGHESDWRTASTKSA